MPRVCIEEGFGWRGVYAKSQIKTFRETQGTNTSKLIIKVISNRCGFLHERTIV